MSKPEKSFDIEEAKALALAHFLDRAAPCLYCAACGARTFRDCTCTRYEIPLPECES